MKGKLIAQTRVFKIYSRDIKFPNGKSGTFEYCSLFNDTAESVMIAALTNDRKLVFVESLWQAADKEGLVFPGGKVDPGESPEKAAVRELAEETNLLAGKVEKLAAVEILPKYLYGRTHLFLATNLRHSNQFDGDEIEEVQIKEIPVNDILKEIKDGKILDGRTVALSLMVNEKLK